jgi:hypothetical protein
VLQDVLYSWLGFLYCCPCIQKHVSDIFGCIIISFQSHTPERMFSYHAGLITGMDTSPVAHFVATTGVDRKD